MMRTALVALGLLLLARPLRADTVYLSGGSVVEGKAVRSGEQVIVQLGSGELRLAARDVVRIERGVSDVQLFEQRLARLAPGDAKGLLALADFCRDHDMRDRELQLLRKLIELEPDHTDARARLGYVRDAARWVPREEQLRAQGFVQYEGRWISPQQKLELEAARARTEQAALERERARTELEAKRAELQRARAAAPEPDSAPAGAQATTPAPVAPVYVTPYAAWWHTYPEADHPRPCRERRCASSSAPEDPRRRPFPIPGARDPFSYFW